MNGNTTHNVPNATQRSGTAFLIPSHGDCMMAHCAHDSRRTRRTVCGRMAGKPSWQTLDRNWHCRYGELDIVSRDDTGIIVFVEVKTRRTLRYGTPQEAVTSSKQINLRHAAVQWLSDSDHRTPHNGVRFDVVTVIVRDGKPLVHHIEGAF